MIEITYRHYGQRPSKTDQIRDAANSASMLPPSFAVTGVRYDDPEFTLLVEPPSDSISTEAVESIAQAFEDHWGGRVDHVKTS